MATAQHEKLDMLSIPPFVECKTFWERVVMPAFILILTMGFPIYKVNQDHSNVAGAAGGCCAGVSGAGVCGAGV